jgi:uncharacterized membrane protein
MIDLSALVTVLALIAASSIIFIALAKASFGFFIAINFSTLITILALIVAFPIIFITLTRNSLKERRFEDEVAQFKKPSPEEKEAKSPSDQDEQSQKEKQD